FTELHRAQYFYKPEGDLTTGLEKIIKFGNQVQAGATRTTGSLFGENDLPEIRAPKIPFCEPWSLTTKLEKEKEVTGIYLSGHPLDNFRFEIKHYYITPINEMLDYQTAMLQSKTMKERPFRIAGFVTEATDRVSKNGNKYGNLTIEDYTGHYQVNLFGEDYARFSRYLQGGFCLFLQGSLKYRMYRENEVEFKVQFIQLLEEVKKQQTRQIELQALPEAITPEIVNFLAGNINTHPGKTELCWQLTDETENLKVKLKSFSKKVELNDDLTRFLEKQVVINVRINIFNN
ncbi:MAG TPA: OB-fold nucleic acid binding domain-containing protein, partial [Chitinophagaceae bacterium]